MLTVTSRDHVESNGLQHLSLFVAVAQKLISKKAKLEARRNMTVWPSGLRRWLKAPFRKGVGSNPTAVTFAPPPAFALSEEQTRFHPYLAGGIKPHSK